MLYTDWLVSRSGDIRTASFKISWNPRGACHMFIDNKIGGKSSNGKLVGGLEHVLFFHSVGNVIIPTDFHSIIFQRIVIEV